MHLIWKRPDGFHKSTPDDFTVLDIDSSSRIWLHKKDRENYPFRVSGGWEDEKASRRINQLVNLLRQAPSEWDRALNSRYEDSKQDTFEAFLLQLLEWLEELEACAKGDTWEVEITQQVVRKVREQIKRHSKNVSTLPTVDKS